jgi:hypothetical protein
VNDDLRRFAAEERARERSRKDLEALLLRSPQDGARFLLVVTLFDWRTVRRYLWSRFGFDARRLRFRKRRVRETWDEEWVRKAASVPRLSEAEWARLTEMLRAYQAAESLWVGDGGPPRPLEPVQPAILKKRRGAEDDVHLFVSCPRGVKGRSGPNGCDCFTICPMRQVDEVALAGWCVVVQEQPELSGR